MISQRLYRIAACVAFAYFALGCATVPVTGRKQLVLLPDSQLATMSLDSYRQVLKESTLSSNAEQVAQVKRVGSRLAEASEQYLTQQGFSTKGYAWEFNLIEDDSTINAWCMSGGKVAVYTGILPITRNDAGLAVVMGHEIAHALAKHGNERMSQGLIVQLGGIALSEALKAKPKETHDLFMVSYGAATQVGAILPYSRLHESEADRIGLTLMAMAGYDPREAIPFWERMNAGSGSRPPQFLSTHPAPQSRIDNIRKHLPEALAIYRAP